MHYKKTLAAGVAGFVAAAMAFTDFVPDFRTVSAVDKSEDESTREVRTGSPIEEQYVIQCDTDDPETTGYTDWLMIDLDETMPLPANGIKKEGYKFIGWKLDDTMLPDQAMIKGLKAEDVNGTIVDLTEHADNSRFIRLTAAFEEDTQADNTSGNPEKQEDAQKNAEEIDTDLFLDDAQDTKDIPEEMLVQASPNSAADEANIVAHLNLNTKVLEFYQGTTTPQDTAVDKYFKSFNGKWYAAGNKPWSAYADSITSIKGRADSPVRPKNMQHWFSSLPNLQTIDGTGFILDDCSNLSFMCTNDVALQTITNVGNWNTINNQTLLYTFSNCVSLQNIDTISSWKTDNVTDMTAVFYMDSAYNQPLDLSSWNVEKVTTTNSMFVECHLIPEIDVSTWSTKSLTMPANTFNGCRSITSIDVNGWDVSKATTLEGVFGNCVSLKELDISSWTGSKATTFRAMFQNDSSLEKLNITSLDTHAANTENQMFINTPVLQEIVTGPGFSFKGNGIGDSANWALWCTPTGEDYTGNWMRIDGSLPNSPTALQNVYNPQTYYGTWVWQRKNAQLNVEKKIVDSYDQTGNFDFRITLYNDDGTQSDYSGSQPISITEIKPAAASDDTDQNADEEEYEENAAQKAAQKAFKQQKSVYNADSLTPVARMQAAAVSGTAYAVLDSNGTLTFGRGSVPEPAAGQKVYTGFESGTTIPWQAQMSNITSVVFEGEVVPSSCAGWFRGATNLQSADLSGLNLQNVESTAGMFKNCSALSQFTAPQTQASKLKDVSEMFSGCIAIPELDVSGINAPGLENINSAFEGMTAMQTLTLTGASTGWQLDGVHTASYAFANDVLLSQVNAARNMGALDSATDVSYCFFNCKALGNSSFPYQQLFNAVNMSHYLDGAGIFNTVSFAIFTMDRAQDISYMFANSDVNSPVTFFDGNSTIKNAQGLFENCTDLVSIDISVFDTTKIENMSGMFAGCDNLRSITLGQNFAFKGSTTNSANWAILPDASTTAPYTGYWCDVALYPNPVNQTPEQIQQLTGSAVAKTWVWASVPYTISFDANGGEGSMPSKLLYWNEIYAIPENGFTRDGYRFTGWNTKPDGTGASLIPGQSISNFSQDDVTLYAQWIKVNQNVQFTDGTAEFTVPGNQTALFPSLPSGYGYKIEELTPDGWTLIDSSNTEGKLKADAPADASFTNQIIAAPVDASITLNKTLEGEPAAAGEFTFELMQDGTVIQTVQNGADGTIAFDPITYTKGGTYTYTIKEVDGKTAGIVYDTRTISASVDVTFDPSIRGLRANIKTDDDTFRNTYEKCSLLVFKTMDIGDKSYSMLDDNIPDILKNKDPFDFKIELTGPDGKPLENVSLVKYHNYEHQTSTVSSGDTLSVALEDMITLENVPYGTTWSITEPTVNTERFDTTESSGVLDNASMNNKTAVASVSNTLKGELYPELELFKRLVGGRLVSGMFTFTATTGDKTLTAECNSAGSITFEPLPFTLQENGLEPIKVDVKENIDNVDEYTYDTSTITATITPELRGDWTPFVSISYMKDGKEGHTFINVKKHTMPESGVKGTAQITAGVLIILAASLEMLRRKTK